MMTNTKAQALYEKIRSDIQEQGRLIKYIGGRTPEEMLLLSGKSMAYSAKLKDVESDERTRRAFGLYIAAWDLRRIRPHSAEVLATISEQRELIESTKRGVTATIERDFDFITALHDTEKMSYSRIAKVLGTFKRYGDKAPHPDTIKKTIARRKALIAKEQTI